MAEEVKTEAVKERKPRAPKETVAKKTSPKEPTEKKVAPKEAPAKKVAPKQDKTEVLDAKPVRRAKGKKSNASGYIATGRRKDAIARVRLLPGTGKITINNRDMDDYFMLDTLKLIVRQPLVLTETDKKYDVIANVNGGGYTGQTGAIRHGIARALVKENETFKAELKKAGFLSRDSRMKERKKYGLHKARKAPQFSKR